jgi:hypothetical protein
VDFDLEAPGLTRYFTEAFDVELASKPGVLELLATAAGSSPTDVTSWQSYTVGLRDFGDGGRLDILTSGQHDKSYAARLLAFDWNEFFAESEGGPFIEELRTAWNAEYDFVLVDSRTGVTDAGGVCTIQLPDIIVGVFVTNHQSVDGLVDVISRAQSGRQALAYDRSPALVLPLPSRFDGTEEFEQGQEWLDIFSKRFRGYFADWLDDRIPVRQALERLKIPYISHFSFGERLPVLVESGSDPLSVSFALAATTSLLESWKFQRDGSWSDRPAPGDPLRIFGDPAAVFGVPATAGPSRVPASAEAEAVLREVAAVRNEPPVPATTHTVDALVNALLGRQWLSTDEETALRTALRQLLPDLNPIPALGLGVRPVRERRSNPNRPGVVTMLLEFVSGRRPPVRNDIVVCLAEVLHLVNKHVDSERLLPALERLVDIVRFRSAREQAGPAPWPAGEAGGASSAGEPADVGSAGTAEHIDAGTAGGAPDTDAGEARRAARARLWHLVEQTTSQISQINYNLDPRLALSRFAGLTLSLSRFAAIPPSAGWLTPGDVPSYYQAVSGPLAASGIAKNGLDAPGWAEDPPPEGLDTGGIQAGIRPYLAGVEEALRPGAERRPSPRDVSEQLTSLTRTIAGYLGDFGPAENSKLDELVEAVDRLIRSWESEEANRRPGLLRIRRRR